MKLAAFTTKESYVTWLNNEIEAIRNNGLYHAEEAYESALKGEGKDFWLRLNNITDNEEEAWNSQLNWLKGNVEYLNRKIKRYQRELLNVGF